MSMRPASRKLFYKAYLGPEALSLVKAALTLWSGSSFPTVNPDVQEPACRCVALGYVGTLRYCYCCDGVSLCLSGTLSLTSPLFVSQMIYERIWSSGGEILTGEDGRTRRETCLLSFCPSQILHGLSWARSRASVKRSRHEPPEL
jgi:hypothetical protein